MAVPSSNNPLIIFGSARSVGNTLEAVQIVLNGFEVPLVDLSKLKIGHYDYGYENKGDDFIPLAERMMEHNPIILATPVYWYSMCALMKTFLDRWSDLLDIRKDLGRRLAGKELYLITSYGGEMPRGFEDPFSQTCGYMNMHYNGCFYFYSGENLERKNQNASLARTFASKVFL
jgi:putative NADPH-quinone reductase